MLRETFTRQIERTQIEYMANDFKGLRSLSTTTRGVRVIDRGKLVGFEDNTGMLKLDTELNSMLEYGQDVKWSFSVLDSDKDYGVTGEEVSEPELLALAGKLVEELRADLPELRVDLDIAKLRERTKLEVGGKCWTYEVRYWRVIVGLRVVVGQELLELYDYYCDIVRPDEDIIQKFKQVLVPLKFKDATWSDLSLPIVLTPIVSIPIFSLVLKDGLSGEMVYRGISPLKLGTKLKKQFNLEDRPMERGLGWHPFDDEGVPALDKVLISDGEVVNLFNTLHTAHELGMKPGNAFRDTATYVSPNPLNLYVSLDDDKLSLDGMRYVKVYSVLGAGQSNTLTGDIRFKVTLAVLYEGREPIARVKPFSLSFNLYDIMDRIYFLSPVTPMRRGITLNIPHVLIENLEQ